MERSGSDSQRACMNGTWTQTVKRGGLWVRGVGWVEEGKREKRNWDNCNRINNKNKFF